MYHKNTLLPPNINIPSLGDYKNVPELLVAKAKYFTELGREYYEIDAVTREKRYFAEFDNETRKIASAFYKLGLRKGDMVIFMPSEMIKLHIFIAGVWRANGVCRASYPEDDIDTIRYRIEEGKSRFILCDHAGVEICREAVKGISWKVEVIVMGRHVDMLSIQKFLEEDDGSACPPLEVGPDDTALVLCTSGTTGPSKGAVYTHAQLLYNIHMFSLYPFTDTKPNMLFCKGTHASGSTFPFALLISGKTCIVTAHISNEITIKTVHEMKPGFAFAFPTFLLTLVGSEAEDYDMSSLEILWSGGIIITPTTKKWLLKLPNVTDFINGYGLTESMIGTTSAIIPATKQSKSIQDLPDLSIGRTYPDEYIQIRDVETLEVLGANKVGEICVKNPGSFKEYFGNPEATQKAFIDGFVRTGDVGYYDENGFVFIKDRLKDVFKYFNNHISPTELEEIIEKHGAVREVCVVGIPAPDGGGEVPRAYVTLNRNSISKVAIPENIRKFVDDQLPDYKRLRGGVCVVPYLPRGKTGKITRNLVPTLLPEWSA